MDCSACRSQFSQSFDGRLAGENRQGFIIHVQTCEPCSSEYALYRRVFSAVRGLPEEAPPPFRAPSEVPGSLSATPAIGSRPRFARVAAAIVIAIGLVGSHVLVFEWSRDRASRESSPTTPRIAPTEIAATMLPAALRDHVDATDLFIRTAANLPDDPASQDLAYADWTTTNLVERTKELRAQIPTFPAAQRGMIAQYLDDMDSDFVPSMRCLIQNEGDQPVTMRQIREKAVLNRVVMNGDLERMREIVAPLARGTSFPRGTTVVMRNLKPDARLFLESKHLRLAGDMLGALDGFQKFENDFQKSPLRPVVQSVRCETLGATGRYADQWTYAGNVLIVRGSSGPDPLAMRQFLKTGSVRIVVSFESDPHAFRGIFPAAVTPLKSEGLPPACLRLLAGNEPEAAPAAAPAKLKVKTPK